MTEMLMRILLMHFLLAGAVLSGSVWAGEIELVNGMVLTGTVNDRLKGSTYDFYQKVGGTWKVTVTHPSGVTWDLFSQQVHQVRQDSEPAPVLVTPLDMPPETFPETVESPYRPGTPILPFGWRGNGSGIYPDADVPEAFRPIWRVKVRSLSHSSPVIAGDRIFIIDHPHRLVCYDRRTGDMLWQRHNPAHLIPNNIGMPKNDFVFETYRLTSATPVTDGRNVYVHFGHGMVVCYSVDGGLRWCRQYRFSIHTRGGLSNSPVIGDGVLVIGAYKDETMTGLDLETGETRWTYGNNREWSGVRGTLGTWTGKDDGLGSGHGAFLSLNVNGKRVVMNCEGSIVDAAGNILYKTPRKGSGAPLAPTPTWWEDTVFLPLPMGWSAYRPLKDQTWQHLWNRDKIGAVNSPLAYKGLIYVPSRSTILALDTTTGETVASVDGFKMLYYSPVIVGDRMLLINDNEKSGAISILKTGREMALERTIDHDKRLTLGLALGSLPVFAGNRWYYRDKDYLWCLDSGPRPAKP